MKRGAALAMLAFGCLAAAMAQAAFSQPPLADPTRPPSALPSADDAKEPAGPRLQSVLISPNRRVAVIDGKTVTLGAKVNDATVVRIAETEVLLRRGTETEVLKLTPFVEKKAVRARARTAKETSR